MRRTKRFLAALVCLCMVVCLLPTVAFADSSDPATIQLGIGDIAYGNTVYYGTYNSNSVAWYAIGTEGAVNNSTFGASPKSLFLFAQGRLGTSAFYESSGGFYSCSTLQGAMTARYNGFSTVEQAAIADTTLKGDSMYSVESDLQNQKLFPLSNDEVSTIGYSTAMLKDSAGWWRLRSSDGSTSAYCVDEGGSLRLDYLDFTLGVRPAFNLNLNSVLFTSAAVGGKSSGTVGAGALNSNLTPSTTSKNTWKLTLLDSTRTFNVTTTAVSTTTAGGDVSIAYSGAKVGTTQAPEYLSAMLVDGSNNVLYYGRLKSIAASTDASGTQSITIPALTAGTYTLKIFNEQYNGDYNTDYSSAIKDVALTVTAPTYAITYNANGGGGTMAGGTATAGTAFTLPACGYTAPAGHRFKEWAIGSTTGTKAAAGGTHTFTAAATIYAIWENIPSKHAITYQITGSYFANDGYAIQLNIPYGTPLTLIADDMSQSGYTFSGWSGLPATMPDHDVTVTGSYTLNITLSPAADKTFTAATVGYGGQTAHSVTVTNNSTGATGDLTVALSGTNADSFTLSQTTIGSIPISGNASFTVVPKTGLTVGTYTATVTVSGANNISEGFDVSFMVNPPIDYTSYYTLSFEVNGGSAISSVTREEYTTVDLTKYTPIREGYTFTGWYADKELTTKITSIRLTRNTAVYAGWAWVNPFTDVADDDWFHDDVEKIFELGLMEGTSDTTFSPYAATTRGMIVTILYRLENEPSVTGACPFTDVKSGSYYEKAITWAAENGIVGGYGSGKFGPDDPITREQLAAILYCYEQYKGGGFVGSWYFPLDYPEAAEISAWADEAMHWCVMNGIIQGSDGNLMPKDGATRAQAAAMLVRFLNAADQ